MATERRPPVVVHADESCLGNQNDGPQPGGAGSLVEIRHRGEVVRRDLTLHSPGTTNNRMALAGAHETLAALSKKGRRCRIFYVSDSRYLVDGMTKWVHAWRKRGWRRKGGPIENLELWQDLTEAAARHDIEWKWVRGHAGHAKNEYVNDLAIAAAREQTSNRELHESRFLEWLSEQRARGHYQDYDPDADFQSFE